MSYIEDLTWKNNNGEPLMEVGMFHHSSKFICNGPWLGVLEDGWCSNCQNPKWTWTIFDTTGEAVMSSIGGYVSNSMAEEEMVNEMEGLS